MAVASCLNCGAALPDAEPGRIVSCPKCNYEQRVLAPPREEHRRSDDRDAAATRRERKARKEAQAADGQRAPAAAPAAPPGPPATPPHDPREAPRQRMFVKAGLLALVAAGMAVYYLTNRPPDNRPPPTPPASVQPAAAEAPTVRPLTLAELRSLDREGEVEVAAGDPAGGFAAFDPALNIPWATMIAQSWSTDCVLSTLELRGVAPTGALPVTSDSPGSARYRFFSPESRRRAAREDVPAGTPPLLTDLDLVVSAGKLRVSLARPADPARLDLFGQVMLDSPAPPQGPCPLLHVMELLRAKRQNLMASSHELRLLNSGHDDAWVWLDVLFPEYPVPAEGCGAPAEAPMPDEH
jgi:DNA-directed RNA polymerase subunit RPC12/RpoP